MASATAAPDTTADPAELAKFAALGRELVGSDRADGAAAQAQPGAGGLHPRSGLRQFGRNPAARAPLAGLEALDIGCGGGLLAEPLTRLGAEVTGIDPVASNTETAAWHAEEVGLEITYETIPVEAVAAAGRRFDLVVASEVIEHVSDVPLPGRRRRRHPPRWAGDPLDPEPHLGQLLEGDRRRRVRAGLAAARHPRLAPLPDPGRARPCAPRPRLRPLNVSGIGYDGARDSFALIRDPSVNYLMAAGRD